MHDMPFPAPLEALTHPAGICQQGFFGCKHFSKANALLAKEGLPQINWSLDRV